MNTGPLVCLHGDPPPADLPSWEAAWSNRSALDFDQSWLPAREADFMPARAQVGWSIRGWHVLGILQDQDIFNTARGGHEPSWKTGDVFEIFFRPEGQDSYFEIHITPENSGARFRFPSAEFYGNMNAAKRPDTSWVFEHCHASAGLATSTLVQKSQNRWLAGATMPFADYLENGDAPTPIRPWNVSFGRYDYTRGRALPVCSSPSPYPVAAFHNQAYWSRLDFALP